MCMMEARKTGSAIQNLRLFAQIAKSAVPPRRSVAIFGAGQAGRMLLKVLRDECYEVIAFVDTHLSGQVVDGLFVIKPEELVTAKPDLVFIAILNDEADQAVRAQLLALGFNADSIQSISLHRRMFDIRLATLRLLANELIERNVGGAVAELGVYTGTFAAHINALFPERTLYLFDTFEGFDLKDVSVERERGFSRAQTGQLGDTSEEIVRRRLRHPDRAVFKKGYFPDTAAGVEEQFAFVSIDADLYQPVYEGMKFFYPHLSRGACMIVHDFNNTQFKGAGEAVRRYCREEGIFPVPLCDLHGSAVIVR